MWVRKQWFTSCLLAATLLTIALISGLPVPIMGQDVPPLLADASVNRQWHVAGASGLLLYMGDDQGQTPQLALNRQACGGRFLRLRIESNVNTVRISSGESELTLSAPAERHMTLTLDSASDPPSLILDHEPLAEQQGQWVKMVRHESDEQIVVSFVGATYANVTLGDRKPLATRIAEGSAIESDTPPAAGVDAASALVTSPGEGEEPFAQGPPLYAPLPGDFPALRIPKDQRPTDVLIALNHLAAQRVQQDRRRNRYDHRANKNRELRGTAQLQYPIYKTVTKPNPESPYGLNPHSRQLTALFERVVTEVARMDRTDEKHREVLDDAGHVLADFTQNNWEGLEKVLNVSSRNGLYNPQAQLGQAVVAIGTLLVKNPIKHAPPAAWAVSLSSDKEHVVAVDPVLFNATPGQKVLVGGLLAGFVDDAEFGLTPVLQNVLLVTPDHEGAQARLKREHGV